MFSRSIQWFAVVATMLAAGCRDNGPLTPVDLSNTGGGGDMAMAGKNYTPASVAMMRQGAPGDYELADVVAIALTPSSASPHLFVQDAGGGDYSAMEATCSSSSTSHPCTVASTVKTVAIGHKVTIKGTYIKASMANGGSETFYIDTITDNGAAAGTPAPLAMTETDIVRGAKVAAKIFQKVTVTPSEDLVMYDWSPAEMKYSGTWPGCTTVPFMFGFSMAPMSANLTASAVCTTRTMQPASVGSNAKEILIGTNFYKDFHVSTDCQCAGTHTGVVVPTAQTTWPKNMAMTGVLIFDVPFMMTTGYQYFAPTEAGVLTNTATPP
jgi:hypothetical protein